MGMLADVGEWITRAERKARNSFGHRIDTPFQRALSHVHLQLIDHSFLRVGWRNFHQIAPGVFRANQPTPHRIRTWVRMGFKSVLNLRGATPYAHYLLEQEQCDALGLPLYNLRIWARQLPPRSRLLELIAIFEQMEKPVVMHCKSGADRTGIAAGIYLMLFEGRDVAAAKEQLSMKYLHWRADSTGILDFFFEEYERAQAATGIGLLEWITTVYDPDVITDAYEAWKGN